MSRKYGRRSSGDRRQPVVLEVAPGLVHESGPERPRDWAPECVAVMAHWSTDPVPSRSVVTMLRELDAAGFATVLVSAAEVPGPLSRTCAWAPGGPALPSATTVLRRANVGYDFGSWAAALSAFPGVRRAAHVLLVNDSLIGPFSSLTPVLDDFASCPTPVWGIAGSLQHRRHFQSFLVGYRDGALDQPALRTFWSGIRVESRKAKIVRYNEMALSEVLDDEGIAWQTMFEPDPEGPPNPTIEAWDALLEEGFPFVKREAVVAPIHRVPDWSGLAAAVRRITHQDLEAWLPPGTRLEPPPSGLAMRQLPEQVRYVIDVEGIRGLWGPIRSGSAGRILARRPWTQASPGRADDVPGARVPGR